MREHLARNDIHAWAASYLSALEESGSLAGRRAATR